MKKNVTAILTNINLLNKSHFSKPWISLKQNKFYMLFLMPLYYFKCVPQIFYNVRMYFFFHGATDPCGPGSHCQGFTITLRHTTFGRTRLEEWSASRRDLYLTTHNNHKKETSMIPGGIRTRNPSTRAAADTPLRPRSHWYRPTDVFSNWL